MRSPLTLVTLGIAGLLCLAPGGASAQITVTLPPGSTSPLPPYPLPPPRPLYPHCSTRLCGEQHWNFEPTGAVSSSTFGNLQGWTGTLDGRTLTAASLTAGSNVVVSRVLSAPAWSIVPPGHEQLTSMHALRGLGGDYWDTPYHTGYEGSFWLGSFENHPTLEPEPFVRGDGARMDVTSPEFSIDGRGPRYVHFLASGGCSPNEYVVLEQRVYRRPGVVTCAKQENRVAAAEAAVREACGPGGSPISCIPAQAELAEARAALDACRDETGGATGMIDVPSPVWEPATVVFVNPITHETTYSTPFKHARTGVNCSEAMSRVTWDAQSLIGRPEDAGYRIRVIDGSSSAHIGVDDIWVTNAPTVPEPKLPVWGAADLHAHLMNEKGTMAFDDLGTTPESRGLWGTAFGPLEQVGQCNDTHTTNDWSFNSYQDEVFGTTYTLCRDICLNMIDGAGRNDASYHDTRGGSGASWAEWPLWSSAIHQQMHWSWVHRAYEGGLRLMVAAVGNAESIAFGLAGTRSRTFTSDQDALAMQIPAIFEFARQNSTWAEVALTPQDARRIIRSGRLAIVIGAELDHIMDNCDADVTTPRHHTASDWSSLVAWAADRGFNIDVIDRGELGAFGAIGASFGNLAASTSVMHVPDHPRTCTPAQIEARLDALYRAGVRQILPMHFSDNSLGGYAITDILFTSNAIFGDPDARPPTFMTPTLAASLGIDMAGISNDLGELINVPVWIRLDIEQLISMSDYLPPGAGRVITDFIAGHCIEDDGWRAVAAIFTFGASEVHCAASELTKFIEDLSRESIPWMGAADTAAVVGLGLPASSHAGPSEELPSHINARGLQPDGATFIDQMMRRGMLLDVQHSSERTKNEIVARVGGYPLMASHGGAQVRSTDVRTNENVLSLAHLRRVYQSSAPGLIGAGTQSAQAFRDQVRGIRAALGFDPGVGVALGTDMNGFDWHSFPRFGPDGYFQETPDERRQRVRDGRVDPMVNYAAYDMSTNSRSRGAGPDCNGCTWPTTRSSAPPLSPSTVIQGGRVVRTFDINFDGYSHYGMTPDFLQEVSTVGATKNEMATVMRSAEATVRMWEASCAQAYASSSSAPASIEMGCGPRGDYP